MLRRMLMQHRPKLRSQKPHTLRRRRLKRRRQTLRKRIPRMLRRRRHSPDMPPLHMLLPRMQPCVLLLPDGELRDLRGVQRS